MEKLASPELLSPDLLGEELMTALAAKYRSLAQIADREFVFRPARDAAEIRSLSRLPVGVHADVLTRVWRSFMGDALVARGLKGVYCAGGDPALLVEGARGYFGFAPNLVPVVEIRQALEKALESAGNLACVPWPEQAGAGQWWPILNEQRFRDLHIVVGWPALPGASQSMPRVAVVGRVPVEPSGDDETLATVHDDRMDAESVLNRCGLAAQVTARARTLALIRFPEFVGANDPRLQAAREAGLDGLRIVGVRPRP